MHPRPLTVDFYIYATHEVAVWEPIWQSLRRRGVDAQFVLEPPGVHTAMGTAPKASAGWRDDKASELVPLVDEATHEAIAAVLHGRGLPWLDARREDADAVVTTQGAGWLWPYAGLRIKTEYGVSAFHGSFSHGEINVGHDAVLAHGPYSASAIRSTLGGSRVHVVGFPKWAPAFRERMGRDDARESLRIPSGQRLLAWLPTWAHNSGIDEYAGALAELAEHYLVIAKPHHNNVRFETERLASIDQRISVRHDLHSLVELIIAADVVVADARSGALTEAVLADRPVVALLPRGTEPVTEGVLRGFEHAVVWCDKPEDLHGAIDRACASDLAATRAAWRHWFFGDIDGQDDERAAGVIVDLIRERREAGLAELRIATLDRAMARLELRDRLDPRAVHAAFVSGWPRWPGHPHLLRLLGSVRSEMEVDELLDCSRALRVTRHVDHCPLVANRWDPTIDPVRRLAATAALALELEDLDAAQAFTALAAALEPDRYVDALLALDRVPSSLPSFVWSVASTPERCASLADALRVLGAAEQADLVTTHGCALADGLTVLP